jgi:DNA polymerase III delta subunit
MLFANDLESWTAEAIKDHGLQPHDIVRLTADADTDIDAWLNYELSDDDYMFSPRKVTMIKSIENLKSAQISDLMDHLEKAEVTHHLVLTQASGAIVKRVDKALTEKVHDFKIPDKPDAAATWARGWLKERGVAVSQNALKQLAEFAGEEQHEFASVLNALSTVESKKELGWEEVRRHAGDLGGVKIFDITNAIARGDKEGSVLAVQRLGSAHPLQLIKMLEKRYRGYLALLGGGGEETAAKVGVSTSPSALNFMIREAKKLGEAKSIKSLQIVGEAERGIKGESSLSADDAVLVMVIKLADLFARQK